MNKVAVIGAGAWGTALAIQAHRAGRSVTLWTRTPFPGRTSPHLPGFPLPGGITIATELPDADATILAVPLQYMRAVAERLPPGGPVLVCAKGVEATHLRLPLEVLSEALPGTPAAVLTGPNFAHEVAAGLPAAAVVAASDSTLRAQFIALLGSPAFRLYGNDDPVGAQIGGAAKNVIAIAAGVVIGAGLGENARAALITRGLAELGRLAAALGGRRETIAGLSGLGDLMLTCTGTSSRNFRCGLALGRGEPLGVAIAQAGGVVEGVATAPALVARAAGIDLPVCAAVAALLAGRTSLPDLITALMSRPTRDE
jgi:glycerol-3-phosphate dehydrogenase (NAD(P)+)